MTAKVLWGPLRRVVRCVRKAGSYRTKNGREQPTLTQRELLECGHLFEAPYGLHGTTIGDRDSRHCPHCAANKPADDLTGWSEL
jgi:hypothetical protein